MQKENPRCRFYAAPFDNNEDPNVVIPRRNKKRAIKQEYPRGWNEKKVLAVIAHYYRQTDEEGAAEFDAAPEAPGKIWEPVPIELVGAVNRLIADHVQRAGPAGARNRKKKGADEKDAEVRGARSVIHCLNDFPAMAPTN
jgi:hypothetical protein